MLGCYLLTSVTPWIGLSPYYYNIVMDDMIIIINVDYIRRRMEGRAIPSDVLFHLSHPRPRVPGIGFLTSVPNRVWVVMGSPCLTYLASNISSGSPSCFTICQPCIYLSVGRRQIRFKPMRASG